MAGVLKIQNERDAWNVLRQLNNNELLSDCVIDFDGWPNISIQMNGDIFDSTITTNMMGGIIDLEQRLKRAYALLCYGQAKITKLSPDEKENLRLIVKVTKSSSKEDVNLSDVAKSFLIKLLGKMDAKYVYKMVIVAMLLYTGQSCLKMWLDHEVEDKKLEMSKFASSDDDKNVELIKSIISLVLPLKIIEQDANESRNVLLKSVSEAEKVSIGDTRLTRSDVSQITNPVRTQAIDLVIHGVFNIDIVNTKALDGYKIVVRDASGDGLVFTADVKLSILTKSQITLLKDASFEKTPVKLTLSAKQLKGEIKSALVNKVEKPEGRSSD